MFLAMKFLSLFLSAENGLCFLISERLVFVSQFLTKIDYVSYKLFLIKHNACLDCSWQRARIDSTIVSSFLGRSAPWAII